MDQIRNSVQKGQAALAGLGVDADLQTILSSFGGTHLILVDGLVNKVVLTSQVRPLLAMTLVVVSST